MIDPLFYQRLNSRARKILEIQRKHAEIVDEKSQVICCGVMGQACRQISRKLMDQMNMRLAAR